MIKKINVSLLGLGVGEQHLIELKKNKLINKIKIFDFDKNKAKLLSKKYDVLLHTSTNEVYADKEIDLVVDASYDNFHYRNIYNSIDQKKHIFVEKPAFQKYHEAEKIFKKLKNNKNIFFGTNYILRNSPRFLFLKNKIKKNFFGKIFSFEGDYNYGRLEKITNGWRGKIPFYSVTLGGGVHIVDLAMFILEKKITEVKTYSNKIITKNTLFKYNDFVTSLVKFEDQSIGKITSNFGCVYPHFHKISLYGSKKTFENDFNYGKIYNSRGKYEFKKLRTAYKPKNKSLILRKFIQDIVFKKNRNNHLNQVFNALSVCFAIEKSINTNKTIKVKYFK